MATRIQFRRGSSAQHASFTGAVGEMTVDTDKDVVVVHDGSTAGGFEMLRADMNNQSGTVSETYMPSGYIKHLYEAVATTQTDRTTSSSSFVNHLTLSSFTIPSGYKGVVFLFGNVMGGYDSNAGGPAHRMRLTGAGTYTTDEVRASYGRFNNYTEPHNSVRVFDDIPAGTYTPALQIAAYQGTYIANYWGGTDFFTCTVFLEKA